MTQSYQLVSVVPAAETIDSFLKKCGNRAVTGIDILLSGNEPQVVTRDGVVLIELPLSVRYEGRDSSQRLMLVRMAEHLANVYYSPWDTQFEEPLGIAPKPRPWGKLEEYGVACAQYCASKGFEATVFLNRPGSKNRASLLRNIKPVDVSGKAGLHLPLFLIA